MNNEQKKLIRILQKEFPLCERPYAEIARELGTSEAKVLEMVKDLHDKGMLRRIGVSLFHMNAGFKVNSMLVWDVPEDRLARAAAEAARLDQVTHCYVRERSAAFDYNLYTMVHETTEERFEQLVRELEEMIVPVKFCSLRTVRELKKVGMRYFIED